jgi:3-hydroxyisobutyrate dehydrogenase
MGGPMAANLAKSGRAVVAFDAAGTAEREPDGAERAESAAEVAQRSDVVMLSLPDGKIVLTVAGEVAGAAERRADTLIDLSTIGVAAGRDLAALVETAGMSYLEAPVSGGVNGAAAATLAVMASGEATVWEQVEPLLEPISANRFLVGSKPGQAQAMKLLNNFLSATAMTATSEALIFGEREGLNPAQMIDVLNASSGRNTATSDKFPRMLAGAEELGFQAWLMAKDVGLFIENARANSTAGDIGKAVAEVTEALRDEQPEADFSAIWDFTRRLSE